MKSKKRSANHFDRLEAVSSNHPPTATPNQAQPKIDEGTIKFDSVIWDKNRTEIIGKLAETTYQLKKHHTEWSDIEQTIPSEVIPVVALGIALVTQGMGVSALAPMLEGITAATGMQLSAA